MRLAAPTRTSRRTTSGWSAATWSATEPPDDMPSRSTGSPNASRNAVACCVAMSAIVVPGASPGARLTAYTSNLRASGASIPISNRRCIPFGLSCVVVNPRRTMSRGPVPNRKYGRPPGRVPSVTENSLAIDVSLWLWVLRSIGSRVSDRSSIVSSSIRRSVERPRTSSGASDACKAECVRTDASPRVATSGSRRMSGTGRS